jgi:excisionase family DNA binding protein
MTTTQRENRLIDAKEAAALCGVSISTWYSLVASGKTPNSVRLGRSVKWRLDELLAWIDSGCPARSAWESLSGRKHQNKG